MAARPCSSATACVTAVLLAAITAALVVLLGATLLWGASDEIVACAEDGSDYSYHETVSSTTRTIVTNGCPNHPIYHGDGAGVATNKEATYALPLEPKYSPAQQTSLTSVGGQVGVAWSGAMVYSAFIPSVPRAVGLTTSAPYLEGNTFDQCDGHASEQNAAHSNYHFHVPPSCLLKQLGIAAGRHSPQIGWMADGFPLYGPLGPNGTVMKTCKASGRVAGVDVCLDECAGYAGDIGDGYVYRYYVLGEFADGDDCCTVPRRSNRDYDESFFPFTPACLRGCVPSGVWSEGFGTLLPNCHPNHASPGTTSSFAPRATKALPTYTAGCSADDVCDSLRWRSSCETCSYSTRAPQQRTPLQISIDILEGGFPKNGVVAIGAIVLLASCVAALACRARARRRARAWNQLDEKHEKAESQGGAVAIVEMRKASAGGGDDAAGPEARGLNALFGLS